MFFLRVLAILIDINLPTPLTSILSPTRGEEVKYLRQSGGLSMIKYYIPSPPDLGGEG